MVTNTAGNFARMWIFLLITEMFVPSSSRNYGCMEGSCAMEDCRSASGSGRSNYCWIAANSWGHKMSCGGEEDCREAARSWGNCIFASCAFDRAPSPVRSSGKTCESMNFRKVESLQRECSDEGFTFDSWARRYATPRKLYDKFSPCSGELILPEVVKVLKYCHCYNFCGETQTTKGDCTVEGLERRLDLTANTKTDYKAVCKIDCEPTEKLVSLQRLKNEYKNKTAKNKVKITQGMSSSKTTLQSGSSNLAISGEVGAQILGIFSAKIGISHTTGHNWGQSSTITDFQFIERTISVPVAPGDDVTVYQVVGECSNSDGTTYKVKTATFKVIGKDGATETISDYPSK